jgi:hypothetical protein
MKIPRLRTIALALCCAFAFSARAATIFQAANSTYVAWEAEDTFAIVNAAPTLWAATNDATAGGGRALYQAGVNGTAAPSSLATYAIRFRAAGEYTLSFRWRGDKAYTDLDPNSANSYYRPNTLGDLSGDVANYAPSAANNSRTPPDVNNYAVSSETQTYTVTQEQVDAGIPVILKLGTREAGMFIDRLVLSQNPVTEAEFNGLVNSDTDIIPQGASESFVAFEAERVSRMVNSPPTLWMVTNDATASGNQALYQAGVNGTAAPASLAFYTVRFRSAGEYTLSFRWRGDKSYTDLDPNSANSYYRPNTLGELTGDVANFGVSAANNSRTPPDVNNYAVSSEAQTYTVTQAEVDAGTPVVLTIGTREAGMFIDRIVLSQNPLTEAEFNGLPNSGSIARPALVRAVGSPTLNTVRVTFDRPLNAASVTAARFNLGGGVTVTGATLDPETSRDVILTTSAQTQGANYVVTVNGVTDVSGNAIAANSTIPFTAWKIASGWITRELFPNVTGGLVDELFNSPNFPDRPNSVAYVRNVSIGTDLQVPNYGARFRGYFVPPQTGAYDFFLYGDDDAILSLSTDATPENLSAVLQSAAQSTAFDASVKHTSGLLTAGQRYLFEVLYVQGADAARLGLAVRPASSSANVDGLTLLGGTQVSTFVNPDAGAVNITQQPASATVPAGQRMRLSVNATGPLGGTLFYQWQVNGADIPGANRPTFITPVLSASDSGKRYRVLIGVNGTDVASQEATLTVGPAQGSLFQPFVGINFAGGSGIGTTAGASIATNDVAGAIQQEFFNNIPGNAPDDTQVLFDAQGRPTTITVAVLDSETGEIVPANAAIGTGTGSANTSADHLLMQGSLANNNLPLRLRLSGVPQGNYALLAYSVGFSFNSTYEGDYALTGASSYPTQTVRGQTATEFIANPTYVRMNSTDPANRARGNYVMFENVSPAADGTLTLTVTPQSPNVGNTGYFPPVNALQLVRINQVTVQPTLAVQRQGNALTISWTPDATTFVLESSASLGAGASWSPVAGTPNPINAAGSTQVSTQTGTRFYRLRK